MTIFFYLGLAAIVSWRIKISSFNENYLSREQTNAIKGFFVVLVVLSHSSTYLNLSNNAWDEAFSLGLRLIGQLMVAPFFFYSGFGIAESYSKNDSYGQTFFKKRILKTWRHFAASLVLYVLLNGILKIHYPVHNYVFCWTGFESIGNSNWFVFDIMLLYFLTMGAMSLYRKKRVNTVITIVCILSIVAFLALFFVKKADGWWYNTLLCFPLGMIISTAKKYFERIIQNLLCFIVVLGLLIAAIILTYRQERILLYSACSCIFCLIIVVLSTRISVCNKSLYWLGTHSFSIYILQRIPMIILEKTKVCTIPFIFILLSLLSSIILAAGFDSLYAYVINKFASLQRG